MRDDVVGIGPDLVVRVVELLDQEWQERHLPEKRGGETIARMEIAETDEDIVEFIMKLESRDRGTGEPAREDGEAFHGIGRVHRLLQWEVDIDLLDQHPRLIDQSLHRYTRQRCLLVASSAEIGEKPGGVWVRVPARRTGRAWTRRRSRAVLACCHRRLRSGLGGKRTLALGDPRKRTKGSGSSLLSQRSEESSPVNLVPTRIANPAPCRMVRLEGRDGRPEDSHPGSLTNESERLNLTRPRVHTAMVRTQRDTSPNLIWRGTADLSRQHCPVCDRVQHCQRHGKD